MEQQIVPSETFIFFCIFFVALMVYIIWLLLLHEPKRITETRKKAKQISEMSWYVKKVGIYEYATVLEIATIGWKRDFAIIPFRPAHPSAKEIKKLEPLEVTNFDFRERSFDCALDTDICGYLILKEGK